MIAHADPHEASSVACGADFAQRFRDEAWTAVEYSLGRDPLAMGVMVPGQGSGFAKRAIDLARGWPSWARWRLVVDGVNEAASTDAFFFKLDSSADQPVLATLYMRYLDGGDPSVLGAALARNPELGWKPGELAAKGDRLDASSAALLGVRLSLTGQVSTTVYWFIGDRSPEAARRSVRSFADTCSVSSSWRPWLDLADETLGARPEFVGLARPSSEVKGGYANVGLLQALELLPAFGADEPARRRVAEAVMSTGGDHLSYFSLTFGPETAGRWKVYVAMSPRRRFSPISPF